MDYAILVQQDPSIKRQNRYVMTHFHVRIDWPIDDATEDMAQQQRYISKELYEQNEKYAQSLHHKLFENYGFHHAVGGRRTAAVVAAQFLKRMHFISTVYVSSAEARTLTRLSERGISKYVLVKIPMSDIASGDDDLFINKVATKKNTHIVIDQESFMYSDAKTDFKAWIRQKLRHMSAGKLYKTKFKIILGLFGFSHILFYASLITLLILWVYPLIIITLFLLRFFSKFVVHKFILGKLKENNLFLFSLIWDMIHFFIVHTVTLISVFRKRDTWN